MNKSIENSLQSDLEKRRLNDSFRKLSCSKAEVDFCSNDYLGLSNSIELKEEIDRILVYQKEYSVGSTGSRLLSGNSIFTETTESYLAKIFKGEKALLFNSGYNANLGLLSSVPKRGDVVLYDELSHASIKDGIRLSMAKKIMFRHNDLQDLDLKLSRTNSGNRFIVVESIYSMDGDRCPLKELVEIAKKHEAHIILDEAHSTGVMGHKGAGMAIGMGLDANIFARIYTFGKAMGVHGACVVGSTTLINYLINFSRSFIYTTALPFHSVASIRASFDILGKNIKWQHDLDEKIKYFISYFNKLFSSSLERTKSESAIQSILISDNIRVKSIAKYINKCGYDVRPILSPTVKQGQERIRICLHRYNSKGEIEGMLNALKEGML
ncbi:MAG: pyridoxal phosphate-dependent aminotransferase family protein [Cyclobacteriaceae bacterium]|nr:pyridoxal phosphate-dependent aminotransferase family protein [Cyclobacteriaceae bacterium]